MSNHKEAKDVLVEIKVGEFHPSYSILSEVELVPKRLVMLIDIHLKETRRVPHILVRG